MVTRREIHKEDGDLVVEYEQISGERRLRAFKVGRTVASAGYNSAMPKKKRQAKIELAIIENLQREDLNPKLGLRASISAVCR